MEMPHVDTWDLSTYPDKHNGHAGSDVYRFVIKTRAGLLDWHECDTYDENGKVVGKRKLQPKMADVRGLGTSTQSEFKKLKCRWGINPVDVRMAEEKIGGKPTLVQMGLWHVPTFSDGGKIVKWTAVDRRKILQPPYWLDVMKEYKKWREEAYEDFADPYEGQEFPVTQLMEMEAELKELRKLKK